MDVSYQAKGRITCCWSVLSRNRLPVVGDNLVLVEAPTDWNAKGNYKQVYFISANLIFYQTRFTESVALATNFAKHCSVLDSD